MTFANWLRHCPCCTPWPWSTFFRSNIWNVNSKLVRASKNFSSLKSIRVDICHRTGPFRNVVLCNLSLNFQGHTFQFAILTNQRSKNANITIASRMVPLRMLSIMTLSYIIKVTKFKMGIYRQRWELTKNAHVWLSYKLIFAIEWDHWDYCTAWLWPNFSRSNISNANISEMVSETCIMGLYRFWYLPLNGAIPKVVLCDVSLLFQCKIFHMLTSRKRFDLRKYVKYDF